jgi:hypothetical protein
VFAFKFSLLYVWIIFYDELCIVLANLCDIFSFCYTSLVTHTTLAARVASFASNTINIVPGIELGTKTERPFTAIGSMDRMGDKEVGETFHGARINKGVNTVNQGVSLSFDPTTLRCIACTKEHNIISAQQKPVVICLSDQNFVSKFCGDTESCIVVARMENASLDELCDFLLEILDGAKLPHGSIILLGSVTHLHRFGTGIFARDWLRCVHRLESRFGGSQICPLTPVIRECFPTDLLRQMLELAAWMATVYSGTSRGLGETWPYLVNWLSATSADDHLDQPGSYISYIIPLPESLAKDAPVIPQRFQTTSSRSATVPGMCQRATDELLRVLLEALNRDLLAGVNPSILLREPTEELHSKDDDRTPGGDRCKQLEKMRETLRRSRLQGVRPDYTRLGDLSSQHGEPSGYHQGD